MLWCNTSNSPVELNTFLYLACSSPACWRPGWGWSRFMALKITSEAVGSYVGINGSHFNSCEDVFFLLDPAVFCWTERAFLAILGTNTKFSSSTGTWKQENSALFLLLLWAFKWPLLFHVQSLVLEVLCRSKSKSVRSPGQTGFAFWKHPQGHCTEGALK